MDVTTDGKEGRNTKSYCLGSDKVGVGLPCTNIVAGTLHYTMMLGNYKRVDQLKRARSGSEAKVQQGIHTQVGR